MSTLFQITPVAGSNQTLQLGANNSLIAAVKVINLTPYALQMQGFGTDEWLISGGIDLFIPDGSGNFTYTTVVTAQFTSSVSNTLLYVVYYPQDDIPDKKNFPQSTQGGLANVAVTALAVINDTGNTVQTLVESTPPNLAQQTVLITNDGAVVIITQGKTANKTALRIVPGIPGVSDPTYFFGELQLDTVSAGSADFTGAGGVRIGGSGASFIKGWQLVNGTGPGTFNHTLGVIPTAVILSPTSGALACVVGSYTSTQFTVSNILAGVIWRGIVLV